MRTAQVAWGTAQDMARAMAAGDPDAVGRGLFELVALVALGAGVTKLSALDKLSDAARIAPKGLLPALTSTTRTQLLTQAVLPFKGGSLTQAGRALTKHPEVIGLTKNTLRKSLRTDAALNTAAKGALGKMVRTGTGTIEDLPRYGLVIEVYGSTGFGARWLQETGEFIGFINPK